ncbi:MAG TPA: FecR family protein [Coleofasciculaceae cyanobacterium]
MFRRIALLLTIVLWGSNSLLLPTEASAQTALTRAVIESLRNQVRLMPRNQSARAARTSDTMAAGDALATARASMAQLRFNDGSLARLGEQVVFRFVPGTRTFTLSNGTALLLIPPGRGRTGVRTPNAAAGIRGSALFVRYSPETNTTLIGALTNSGIEVFNDTASQRQELKAGTMAVIVKNRIERVYEFDLNTFYQTSELAQGLNLTQTESTASPDAAIALVQSETSEAVEAQLPLSGEDVIETPSFVRLSANPSADFPDVGTGVIENTPGSRQANSEPFRNSFDRNTIDVRSALEVGEIRDTQIFNSIINSNSGDNNNPSTPSTPGICGNRGIRCGKPRPNRPNP